MPSKRVEQAPERKLPAICSAAHNYQQDAVEWAYSACRSVLLTHDLHSPCKQHCHTTQRGPTGLRLHAGLLQWQREILTLHGISPACFPEEVLSPTAATSSRTFCNDGNVLYRYARHPGWQPQAPYAATGHLTCGLWDRGTRFFNLSVINLNVNSTW